MAKAKRARVFLLAAAMGLLVLAVVGEAPAGAATLNVPGTFPTIQAALDGAAPGDTIVVQPGVYRENLNFHGKNMTLTSATGPFSTSIEPAGGTGVIIGPAGTFLGAPNVDYDGLPRPVDGNNDGVPRTDIGAFELQSAATVNPLVCDGRQATIVGTSGDDPILGTPGADVIVGLGGNDFIAGLGGDDVICGGEGNDRIAGGDGNDRLVGGLGNDDLAGDSGDDVLVDDAGTNRLAGGLGVDACTAAGNSRAGCEAVTPGTTATVTLINQFSSAVRLQVNGATYELAAGQEISGLSIVPAADGHDTISVTWVDVPTCGVGDAMGFFIAGKSYVLTVVTGLNTCTLNGSKGPDFKVSPA